MNRTYIEMYYENKMELPLCAPLHNALEEKEKTNDNKRKA